MNIPPELLELANSEEFKRITRPERGKFLPLPPKPPSQPVHVRLIDGDALDAEEAEIEKLRVAVGQRQDVAGPWLYITPCSPIGTSMCLCGVVTRLVTGYIYNSQRHKAVMLCSGCAEAARLCVREPRTHVLNNILGDEISQIRLKQTTCYYALRTSLRTIVICTANQTLSSVAVGQWAPREIKVVRKALQKFPGDGLPLFRDVIDAMCAGNYTLHEPEPIQDIVKLMEPSVQPLVGHIRYTARGMEFRRSVV